MKKTAVLFGLLALFGVNVYSQASLETEVKKELNSTDGIAETCELSYDFIYESNDTNTCIERNDLFGA